MRKIITTTNFNTYEKKWASSNGFITIPIGEQELSSLNQQVPALGVFLKSQNLLPTRLDPGKNLYDLEVNFTSHNGFPEEKNVTSMQITPVGFNDPAINGYQVDIPDFITKQLRELDHIDEKVFDADYFEEDYPERGDMGPDTLLENII
jgi:hypothetical protein